MTSLTMTRMLLAKTRMREIMPTRRMALRPKKKTRGVLVSGEEKGTRVD